MPLLDGVQFPNIPQWWEQVKQAFAQTTQPAPAAPPVEDVFARLRAAPEYPVSGPMSPAPWAPPVDQAGGASSLAPISLPGRDVLPQPAPQRAAEWVAPSPPVLRPEAARLTAAPVMPPQQLALHKVPPAQPDLLGRALTGADKLYKDVAATPAGQAVGTAGGVILKALNVPYEKISEPFVAHAYLEATKQPGVPKDLGKLIGYGTEQEIAQYRRQAPWYVQLGAGVVLDPLNLVGAGLGKVGRLAKLRRAEALAAPAVGLNLAQAAAEMVQEGRRTNSLLGRVAPFRLTNGAQANRLVNDSVDVLNIIAHNTEAPVNTLWQFVGDPDSVAAVTDGFSSSRKAKRTAALLQKVFTDPHGNFDSNQIVTLMQKAKGDHLGMVAQLATKLEDAAYSFFPVRKKHALTRSRDVINNYLSLGFMGYNPGFLFRNGGNNLGTSLVEGIIPFGQGAAKADFLRAWGPMPMAGKMGYGATGQMGTGVKAREFVAGLQEITPWRQTIKDMATLKGPTLKGSATLERVFSENITTKVLMKTWDQQARKLVRRWDAELRTLGVPAEVRELVLREWRLARNPDEALAVVRRLRGTGGDLAQHAPVSVVDDLIDAVGEDAAPGLLQIAKTPEGLGAAQAILEATAANADTVQDISRLAAAPPPATFQGLEDFFARVKALTDASIETHRTATRAMWRAHRTLGPEDQDYLWRAFKDIDNTNLRNVTDAIDNLEEALLPEYGFRPAELAEFAKVRKALVTALQEDAAVLARTWERSRKAKAGAAKDAIWEEFWVWRDAHWAAYEGEYANFVVRRGEITNAALARGRQPPAPGAAAAPVQPTPPSAPPAAPPAGAVPTAPPVAPAVSRFAAMTDDELQQELAGLINRSQGTQSGAKITQFEQEIQEALAEQQRRVQARPAPTPPEAPLPVPQGPPPKIPPAALTDEPKVAPKPTARTKKGWQTTGQKFTAGDPPFGKEGYRFTEVAGPAQKVWDAHQGGWKLHLTVDPANYEAVDRWLWENHQGVQYKLLSGGDPGEKDFTVYIGSRDDADAFAARLEREIGQLLSPSNAGGEDTVLGATGKVAARFDVQYSGSPYKYYGRDGIPLDRAGQDLNYNLMLARGSLAPSLFPGGVKESVASAEAKLAAQLKRVDGELRQKYGTYYTGTGRAVPEAPTAAPPPVSIPPAKAAAPPTAAAAIPLPGRVLGQLTPEDELRKLANQAGIATRGKTGVPSDKHLLNAIKKDTGIAVAKLEDLLPEQRVTAAEALRKRAAPAAAPEVAQAAKQPWQLPAREWLLEKDRLSGLVRTNKGSTKVKWEKALRQHKLSLQSADYEEMLEEALKQGLPVPPEVLAEYPDLAKAGAAPKFVNVTQEGNRLTANMADLAADYKARGMERTRAWSQYVIDKNLQPGADAKDFYAVFDKVSPAPFRTTEQIAFKPTKRIYYKSGLERDIQVIEEGPDFVKWVDSQGATGEDRMQQGIVDKIEDIGVQPSVAPVRFPYEPPAVIREYAENARQLPTEAQPPVPQPEWQGEVFQNIGAEIPKPRPVRPAPKAGGPLGPQLKGIGPTGLTKQQTQSVIEQLEAMPTGTLMPQTEDMASAVRSYKDAESGEAVARALADYQAAAEKAGVPTVEIRIPEGGVIKLNSQEQAGVLYERLTKKVPGRPLGADVTHPFDPFAARANGARQAIPILDRLSGIPAQPIGALTPDVAGVLEQFARQTVLPQMLRAKAVTVNVATATRNNILGDYAARSNLNEALQWIFPYNFWYGFTYKNWGLRVLRNPALLSNYARYRRVLRDVNEQHYREETGDPKATLPDYWDREVRVPFFGTNYYTNLERMINPLNALTEDFESRVRQQAPGGTLVEKLGGQGPTVWAPLIWGYSKWLADNGYNEAAQQWAGYLTPTSRAIKSVTALAGVTPGGTTPEELVGLPNVQGGDIWERKRIGYYLMRLWRDGTIDDTAFENAAYAQQGPAWERARQMEAVARAPYNLTAFMTGMGLRTRDKVDFNIQQMWDAWGQVFDEAEGVDKEAKRRLFDAFDDQWPWAREVQLSRAVDPYERLSDFAHMVLDRLPPGNANREARAAIPGLDKWYDSGSKFDDWTPEEVAAFQQGLEAVARQYDVPTPDMVQEFEAARWAHDERIAMAVAAVQAEGFPVGEQQLVADEREYFTIDDKGQRRAYLESHPWLSVFWDAKRAVYEQGIGGMTGPQTQGLVEKYYYGPGGTTATGVRGASASSGGGGSTGGRGVSRVGVTPSGSLPPPPAPPGIQLPPPGTPSDVANMPVAEYQGMTNAARGRDSAFDMVAQAMYGKDILSLAGTYLALDEAGRGRWRAANPQRWAKLQRYLRWVLAQYGGKTNYSRLLASIPQNAPMPPPLPM